MEELADHDLADRCNQVVGLAVEFVCWPADERRRAALARASVPRVLLVAPGADVPAVGLDEDWIRLPASEEDVLARATQLLRLGDQVCTEVPSIDDQRVLHRAGASVTLTPTQVAIMSKLLASAGSVVSYAELTTCVGQGTSPTREAMDAAMYRLRRRLDGFHLRIGAARGRGYVLTL